MVSFSPINPLLLRREKPLETLFQLVLMYYGQPFCSSLTYTTHGGPEYLGIQRGKKFENFPILTNHPKCENHS